MDETKHSKRKAISEVEPAASKAMRTNGLAAVDMSIFVLLYYLNKHAELSMLFSHQSGKILYKSKPAQHSE